VKNPLAQFSSRAGTEDTQHATRWTTPVRWWDTDGACVGFNNEVWLWRTLPLSPIEWEDAPRRLDAQNPFYNLLVELGATSVDRMGGNVRLSNNREIHIIGITWEDTPKIHPSATPALADYLSNVLTYLVPRKMVVVGVRLRSSAASQAIKAASSGDIKETLKAMAIKAMSEEVPDLSVYERDRQVISDIFKGYGCRVPDQDVISQMEAWFNYGRTTEVELQVAKDVIYTDSTLDRIEMAAVMRFGQETFKSPHAPYLADAFTHPDGVCIVSVRGELEPPTVARSRLRSSQRHVMAAMEEEAAANDLARPEQSRTLRLAQEVEEYFIGNNEPLLTKCSIVFGRRVGQGEQTYIDELKNNYGLEVIPLVHRQLEALDETLPASDKRVNPFLQDVTVGMLAYAGLQGFSTLGDGKGLYVGCVDPDFPPCYLDPDAAPRKNLPVGCAIFGDLGSGKSFLAQMLATEGALQDHTVIFLNPKGYSTLSPMAAQIQRAGKTASVVKTSALEGQPGFFDPFRYAEPALAAEIATNFILSVITDLTQRQQGQLAAGIKRGALAGARCVGEALTYIGDPQIISQIMETAEGWSSFGMGIGRTPQAPLSTTGGLLLIEVDRKLPQPKGDDPTKYRAEERIGLAVIRLISRASLELLAKSGGGMFIMDEAWTLLGSVEGQQVIDELVREGRSRKITPIFATQKPSDLLKEGIDLEGFISRVFAMKLSDPTEARAALRICGLADTEARIAWLRDAGPRSQQGDIPARAALALHRDLENRHAAILVAPVPPAAYLAWTTNPDEAAARDADAAQNVPEQPADSDQNSAQPAQAPYYPPQPSPVASGVGTQAQGAPGQPT